MLNLILLPGFRIAEREAAALRELDAASRLWLQRYAPGLQAPAPRAGGEPAACVAG